MTVAVKELKKEIIERLDELPKKDVKELYHYVIFLEMRNFIPQIDPSQAYFWTKKRQKIEREVEEDIKAGRVFGPFKSAKELLKHLKK
ncbi:MAG: hypothetical protein ACPL4K_04735 [Candidatus Margulisiibacteriota bacterium]